MIWYQLEIDGCPQPEVEQFCDNLQEQGAVSVTLSDKLDEPVLEPMPGTTPLWNTVLINALFDDADVLNVVKQSVIDAHPSYQLNVSEIKDKDWERAWMDEFHPMQFGERLWIVPSWAETPQPDAVNILLDPGLAFGSGTHPTTALCLEWLDANPIAGKDIIDFGCGSGVLAIAGLKLGANHAIAVDIDEQALIATKDNAIKNSIDLSQLHIDYPEKLTTQVDVLLANILVNPLLSLKQTFHSQLKPGGRLIMSGILSEQVDELCQHYRSHFEIKTIQQKEQWAMVEATPLS